MERAEADGHEPDAELRDLVSRAVMHVVATGYEMGTSAQDSERRGSDEHDQDNTNGVKRSRTEDGPS